VVVEFHPPIAVDGMGGRKKITALAEEAVRSGLRRALSSGRSAVAAIEPGTEQGNLAESTA
jgi:hypothetical protein